MNPAATLSILVKAQGVQSTASDLRGLDQNVRKAGAGIAATEKQGSKHLDKLGKQTTLFGRVTSSGFSRFAVGATGATAALGGVGLAMKSVIGAASDVNESLTKNQVLFRRHAKEVDAFSKRSAESFGISRAAALEYTGVFGNLFNALGVTNKKSADFSVSLTKLAADMASFNNTSIDEALEAIRSGLVGETEPLRKFGVNLQDATLRQQALAMGLTKSTASVLTPYQKALAAQALIVKQTAAAHGDFHRTQGGLANQTRILQARISDLKVTLGTALLPIITTVVVELNKFTSGVNSARDAQTRLQQALGLSSAEFVQFRQAVSNVAAALAPVFNAVVSGWRTTLGGFVQWVRGWVQLFSGIFTGDFKKALDGLKNIVSGALQGVIGVIRFQTAGIRAIAEQMGKALTSGFKGALNLAHELAEAMRDLISKAPGFALGVGKAIVRGIINGIKSAAGGIAGAIGDSVKGAIPKLPDLNPFGEGLGASSIVPVKGGGNLMGARPVMSRFAAVGAANGLHVSSGLRPGAMAANGPSWHGTGEAIDLAGPPAGMLKTFKALRSRFGSKLAELIHTPGGAGIKDGKPFVYTGAVAADHFDHVHVAFDSGKPGQGDGLGKAGGLRKTGTGDGIGVAIAAARKAGFTGEALVRMVAIAGRESHYNPRAQNLKPPDHSIGLWQINQLAHHGRFGSDQELMNPDTNAHAAWVLSGGGKNFGPWSTNRGLSKSWLDKARAAVKGTRGTSSGAASGAAGAGKVSSFDQAVASADVAIADARPYKSGGGAVGARMVSGSVAKAAAIKGKQQVLGARIRKIRAALKGKLTKGTRLRLTQELGQLLPQHAQLGLDRQAALAGPAATDAGVGGSFGGEGGDGGDPNQALIDSNAALQASIEARIAADKEHTDAINTLKAEVKRQTDFANQVVATSNASLVKSIADIVSGQIAGVGVAGRGLMPGAGALARY